MDKFAGIRRVSVLVRRPPDGGDVVGEESGGAQADREGETRHFGEWFSLFNSRSVGSVEYDGSRYSGSIFKKKKLLLFHVPSGMLLLKWLFTLIAWEIIIIIMCLSGQEWSSGAASAQVPSAADPREGRRREWGRPHVTPCVSCSTFSNQRPNIAPERNYAYQGFHLALPG